MNHLCGINFKDRENYFSWENSLSEYETKSLGDFELLHESSRPLLVVGDDNNTNENYKTPKFIAEEGEELLTNSNDGWRKLDKITLFRFLCADRLNDGRFQMQKSHDRLQRALRFRKEYNADAIVSWWLKRVSQKKKQQQQEKVGKEFSRQSSSFLYASATIASGSVSVCRQLVEQVQITPTNKVLHPGFSSTDLAKYERLRIRRFTGRDYKGQPVMFERLGAFLGSGNCSHFSEEEWCRFYVWDLERHFTEMREAAKESGRPIQKYTFCGDGQGIVSAILNGSIWKVVPLLKALVRSVEDYYPEIADHIVLFNVPRVATVFYKAVRSFIDPVTAEKISLHSGSDYEEVFSSLMPLEAIPAEYGGTSRIAYPVTATS